MIDCPNVEMRDQLPDLANESLEPSARVLVIAHIEACAACAAEIEILRTTRLILVTTTPKVNVAGIASALPRYADLSRDGRGITSITAAPSVRSRSWATSWRAAAAVAFLAAGIGSYAVLQPGAPVRPVDSIVATTDTTAGMALTGALADLSDADLRALVDDIHQIEALPSAEIVPMGHAVNAQLILPDSIVRELEIP